MAVVSLRYGAPSAPKAQGTGSGGQAVVVTSSFVADPAVLQVSPDEPISFELAADSLPGEMVITFHEPHFFSAPQFRPGDPPVTLKGKLDHRTFYKCELFVNGKLSAAGDGPQGGGIEPSGH